MIGIASAETVLGKAAARRGDNLAARTHLQKAIEAAEAKRALTVVADADRQTRDPHWEAYQEMVRLLIGEGRFEAALQVAERARGRRLLASVEGRLALRELAAAELGTAVVSRKGNIDREIGDLAQVLGQEMDDGFVTNIIDVLGRACQPVGDDTANGVVAFSVRTILFS